MRESKGRYISTDGTIEFNIAIYSDWIRFELFGLKIDCALDYISIGDNWIFEGYFEFDLPVLISRDSPQESVFCFKIQYLREYPYVNSEMSLNNARIFTDEWIEGSKIEKYNQDFYFVCCATCKWGAKFEASAEGYACYAETENDRLILLRSPKYPFVWAGIDRLPCVLPTHHCDQFELRPGHPALAPEQP
ncbi:hypothetical protein [Deinococcus roseus]|uniref:Uncharacterized protein n=1 Tax=Deinococcus roseus TaxID=392414 RepID=A0ABQ2CT26_9DEIO|nr:hypothetical protein [Deinococcus roseus]GGJ18120.1 hypothetical protein GCM10008938_00320 [Deinococcus roseus]